MSVLEPQWRGITVSKHVSVMKRELSPFLQPCTAPLLKLTRSACIDLSQADLNVRLFQIHWAEYRLSGFKSEILTSVSGVFNLCKKKEKGALLLFLSAFPFRTHTSADYWFLSYSVL